jgi:hypothetical protein
MKIYFTAAFLCLFSISYAQLSGVKNIPGNYSTLEAAITDLNIQGVAAGGVTLKLLAGNPQLAPAGGYVIGGTGSALLSSASAANPVVIQGNGNIITASATHSVGAINDGIIKLVGADYITIKGFVLQENTANTVNSPATSNNMTEFGIAFFYASATDGAQNNMVEGNTISLNRNYRNTFGVFATTRSSASDVSTPADITAATGSNSFNKIYSNTINNINFAVVFIGSPTAANMDNGNDIGGNSSASGNTITNAGSSASALSTYVSLTTTHYVIFSNQQVGENISYNSITSALLTSNITEGGILKNYSAGQPAGTFTSTITNNSISIKNSPTAATGGTIVGINNAGISPLLASATINITDNTIQNCNIGGSTASTQAFVGISNSSAPGLLSINRNLLLNNSITATTSKGNTEAISSTGACGTLNINNNIFRGFTNTSQATTLSDGYFIAIFTGGQVVNTLNINNNSFGDVLGDLFTKTNADFFFADIVEIYGGAAGSTINVNGNSFKGINVKRLSQPGTLDGSIGILTSANVQSSTININGNNFGTDDGNYVTFNDANSGEVWGIVNQGGSSAGSLSISGNNFRKFVNNVPGSSTCTFILNLFATASATMNDNLFTNLDMNTSGNQIFLRNANVTWPANAVVTVSGNKVVGSFNKIAGNGVTFYRHEGPSTNTFTENVTNNQFTNVTVSGSTFVNGIWDRITGANKSITNNLLSNITAQTGQVNAISIEQGNNVIASNTITNIAGQAGVNGIYFDQSVLSSSVNGNNINNLVSSSATFAVNGMSIDGLTATHNIYRNKIYGLQNMSAGTGTVNGLLVNAGQNVTIANNLIGTLSAPSASSITDAVRGINIQSTQANSGIKVYYNTVFLNATSTGADFSTSALYHVASSTATTATLDLRNNILVNTSVANGANGIASAFTRSGPALDNYGSTSNNNLFYAGVLGAGRYLMFDGTNAYQTLAAFKAAVASRESNSVSEMPPFISTNGADATYLHLNYATATAASNSGTSIAGTTEDYDGDARDQVTPDMGADESSSTTLPIRIEYFKGNKQNASVVLEWKISTDDGQSVITLERNAGGTGFASLSAFAPSPVQSQQPFTYIDPTPVAGLNLYRLKIQDRDGKINYSHTEAFNVNSQENIHVFPNPIVSTTVLKIPSLSSSNATIMISDAAGKIQHTEAAKLKAGDNFITLDFSRYSTGSYLVSLLSSDGRNRTVTVVKR